jgi:hypothetical protein
MIRLFQLFFIFLSKTEGEGSLEEYLMQKYILDWFTLTTKLLMITSFKNIYFIIVHF